MKPPVVVLGATGQVGLFAIARLIEAGREVIAVTRHALTRQDGGWRDTDIDRLRCTDMSGLMASRERGGLPGEGPWALLSCGPVSLARELLESHQSSGRSAAWERVVVVGTTSAASKRESPDAAERVVIAGIESDLEAITSRCQAQGAALTIPLAILEPTLIYGCGMDQNLSRVFRWIRRTGFAALARSAAGQRQPLHVADLARTLVATVEAEPAARLRSAVAGASTLPYEDMIARVFEAAERPVRLVRLGNALVPIVSLVSKLAPGVGRVGSEMFRRQARDLVFDDGPARQILGHAPRPFEPSEADFRLPPQVARILSALRTG